MRRVHLVWHDVAPHGRVPLAFVVGGWPCFAWSAVPVVNGWNWIPMVLLTGAGIVLAIQHLRLGRQSRQLKLIRAREAAFIDGAGGVIWEMSPVGHQYTKVSARAESLLGFPIVSWLAPGFWSSRLHPDDREYVEAVFSEQQAAGSNHEIEYRLLHIDGHEVAVRDTAIVLHDAQGNVCGLLGMMIDVTAHRTLTRALEESEARFREVMEQVPNISVQGYDEERRVVFWNSASEEVYGYSSGEVQGRRLEDLIIPPAMRADVIRLHRRWIDTGEAIPAGELGLQHKDGSLVPVYSSHVMTRNSSGVAEMYCLDVDLRDMKRTEAALRESELRFRLTFEQAAVGMCLSSLDGRFIQVNRCFCEIVGYSEAELLTTDFATITHPDDLAEHLENVADCLSGKQESFTLEKRYVTRGKGFVWARLSVSLMHDDQGAAGKFIGVIEDITERRTNEARIAYLAHHDPLTDLPNRTLFRSRLERAMALAARHKWRAVLLFLDLDRFKTINDSLGHAVGDQLLQQVAARLRMIVRDTDTVSRQGGDEFLIVLGEMNDLEDVARVANKILRQVDQPFEVVGHTLSSTASIGVAVYPDDGADVDTLMKNADSAMYSAKEGGRNTFRFYTESMNVTAIERLQLENALRHAVERNELSLHYQPQVELGSGRLLGVEALLRWNSPAFGSVSPAHFIPVAEESGLIVPIGAWVLQEACSQVRRWQEQGLGDIQVAVNLSAIQFRRSDIVATVRNTIAQCGISAHLLELELTESLLMHNAEGVLQTMRELKALGLRLSIDDFGTGYSSLSYLKRFPVDQLKVDRSFVRDVAEDADDAAIVRAIIQLGRSLKLDVIAEGAETAAQIDFLAAEGCNSAQGYYYSPPLPVARLLPILRSAGIPDPRSSENRDPAYVVH